MRTLLDRFSLLSFILLAGFSFIAVGQSLNITSTGPVSYELPDNYPTTLAYDFTVKNTLSGKLYLNSVSLAGSKMSFTLLPSSTCTFGANAVPLAENATCTLNYESTAPTLTDVAQPESFVNTLTIKDALSGVSTMSGIGAVISPLPGQLFVSSDEQVASHSLLKARSGSFTGVPVLNLKPGSNSTAYVTNTGEETITSLRVTIPSSLQDYFLDEAGSCLSTTTLAKGERCALRYYVPANVNHSIISDNNILIEGTHITGRLILPVNITTYGRFQFERKGDVIVSSQNFYDDTSGSIVVRNTGGSAINNLSVVVPAQYFSHEATGDCQTGASLASGATCEIRYSLPSSPTLGDVRISIYGDSVDGPHASLSLPGKVMNGWDKTSGPQGAVVSALAATPDGDEIYAGMEPSIGGLMKSIDNGKTWTTTNLPTDYVIDVAVVPVNGVNTIYASTLFDDILKSTDDGHSWTNGGNDSVSYFESHAVVGSTLYIGGESMGVYKSVNGGNWTRVGATDAGGDNAELSTQHVQTLAVYGTDTLYAGTRSKGVFLSTDGGTVWTKENNGLPTEDVRALVVNDGIAYAALFDGGIYKFNNTTSTWSSAIGSGMSTSQKVVSLAVKNNDAIYAGLDGGGVAYNNGVSDHWTVVEAGLGNQNAESLLFANDTLFAGMLGDGVYRSTDNGVSWALENNGMNRIFVSTMLRGVDSNYLFATTWDGGVFRSADNGVNWLAANTGLTRQNIRSLAVNGTTMYAGNPGTTEGFFRPATPGGLYQSTNEGGSWSLMNVDGETDRGVNALATHDGVLYVGTSDYVFISNDNGQTWTDKALAGTVVFTFEGNNVYAGTSGEGVYKSTSGGDFTPVNTGLEDTPFVQALYVDQHGTVYVTTYGGIYKSIDQGANWISIGTGLPYNGTNGVGRIFIDGNILYTTSEGMVYESTIGSNVWRAASHELPEVRSGGQAGSLAPAQVIFFDNFAGVKRLYASIVTGGLLMDRL